MSVKIFTALRMLRGIWYLAYFLKPKPLFPYRNKSMKILSWAKYWICMYQDESFKCQSHVQCRQYVQNLCKNTPSIRVGYGYMRVRYGVSKSDLCSATVCHCSAVNNIMIQCGAIIKRSIFWKKPHNRHPIARPRGRAMGWLLWY